MIEPVALVREWLAADEGVAELVDGRVSSSFEPGGAMPQLVIYGATGGPVRAAQGGSRLTAWTVTLWAIAGRLGDGDDDRPDTQAAWELAAAVSAACDAIPTAPFTTEGGAVIVEAAVVTATRAVEPDTRWGRATVTLALRAIAPA